MDYAERMIPSDLSGGVPAKKKRTQKKRSEPKIAPKPLEYLPLSDEQIVEENPELLNYVLKLNFQIHDLRSKMKVEREKFLETCTSLVKYFDPLSFNVKDFKQKLEEKLPQVENADGGELKLRLQSGSTPRSSKAPSVLDVADLLGISQKKKGTDIAAGKKSRGRAKAEKVPPATTIPSNGVSTPEAETTPKKKTSRNTTGKKTKREEFMGADASPSQKGPNESADKEPKKRKYRKKNQDDNLNKAITIPPDSKEESRSSVSQPVREKMTPIMMAPSQPAMQAQAPQHYPPQFYGQMIGMRGMDAPKMTPPQIHIQPGGHQPMPEGYSGYDVFNAIAAQWGSRFPTGAPLDLLNLLRTATTAPMQQPEKVDPQNIGE